MSSLPPEERPRERLRVLGEDRLSNAELVGILLAKGVGGKNAVALAQDILARFGGIEGLSRATVAELSGVRGIGPAKAAAIRAAFALGARLSELPGRAGGHFTTAAAVYGHYRETLRPLRKERFIAVFLDARNRILRDEVISEGSLTASVVHPREVFRAAIREAAAAVILVHNHPSGDPEPSPEDAEITRRLVAAGTLVGIRVLDHVVVGRDGYVSFAERRLL
ncbi:MAG: DNA repair protein RadC [Planctomycetota bacterium]